MKKLLSIILALAVLTGTAFTAAFAEEDISEEDYLTGDIAFDTDGLLTAYANSILSEYLNTAHYKDLFSGDKAQDEKALEQVKEFLTSAIISRLESVNTNEYSEKDDAFLFNLATEIRKALSGKNADAFKESVKTLVKDTDADLEKLVDKTIAALKEKHSDELSDLSEDETSVLRSALLLSADAFDDDAEEDDDDDIDEDDEDIDDDDELDEDQIRMLDFLGMLVYAANS